MEPHALPKIVLASGSPRRVDLLTQYLDDIFGEGVVSSEEALKERVKEDLDKMDESYLRSGRIHKSYSMMNPLPKNIE